MPLTFSLPNNSLPKDTLRNLTAMWGLRFVLNHEDGSKVIKASWLSLVGDCVEWPVALLDKFYSVSAKEPKGAVAQKAGLNANKIPIIWSSAFHYFEEAYSNQPELLNDCFKKSIDKLEQLHEIKIQFGKILLYLAIYYI
jgi:hypothetical protein